MMNNKDNAMTRFEAVLPSQLNEESVHQALKNEAGYFKLKGNFFQYWRSQRRLEKYETAHHSPLIPKKVTTKKYKKITKIFSKKNKVAIESSSINVFVFHMNRKKCLQVESCETLRTICLRENLSVSGVWFTFNSKPIDVDVPLSTYGVYPDCAIIANVRLCGGASAAPSVQLPTYQIIQECEKEVAKKDSPIDFELQAHEFEDYYGRLMGWLGAQKDQPSWVVVHLENLFQVLYWSQKCRSKGDYAALASMAYKLFTGKGVVSKVFEIAASDLQGLSDNVAKARDWFNLATSAIENPLINKMRKIYTYLLVQGIMKEMGVKLDEESYLAMDKKMRTKFNSKTGLIMTIIDTAITIAERYDAYKITGDWTSVVHDHVHYAKWTKEADRLISLAPFTSNLEAHNTTYFSFVSDLNDTIEKGEAISRYTKKVSVENQAINRKLQVLQLLKNTEITRRASQKERKQPFGVLLHGSSSVAKSSFTKMLFYFYGKIHGLQTDDHFRYVRNPAEEYWNNFDSSKWCIQMDDVAYLLSSKATAVDPTLDDLLRVVNNVPYVPSQAALEDKGKTPVMAKLVIATTNAPDLNAQDYFHCPLAVRRRLPYIVKVEPKSEYVHANGKFIDPAKLTRPEEGFPDYWRITVQRLEPVDHVGRDSAQLVDVEVFEDVHAFLKHFGDASKVHEQIQTKAQTADEYMKRIRVCPLCYSTSESCECLQALEVPCFLVPIAKFCAVRLGTFVFNLMVLTLATAAGRLISQYVAAKYVYMVLNRWMTTERQIVITGYLVGGRTYRQRYTLQQIASVALVLGSLCLSWKLASHVVPRRPEGESDNGVRQTQADSEDEEFTLEGNTFGTTEADLARSESENVWYKNTVELSRFDLPLASQSLVNATAAQVRDMFAANCVMIEVVSQCGVSRFRTKAVFIRGQRLVWNKHCCRVEGGYSLTLFVSSDGGGLSSNVTVTFHTDELIQLDEVDLVSLEIAGVPPRKDITKFWNKTHIPFTHMVSVRRENDGGVVYTDLFKCAMYENMRIEALGRDMDVYLGVGNEPTRVGLCGSLGVAMTPMGPVIVGFHTIGRGTTAGFPRVTPEQLNKLLGKTCVSGGGQPMFSLNGEEPTLLPPHAKSITRFLKHGVANVYGMLPGALPKARSRVTETPLQAVVCAELQYTVKHGPPVMSGWEPIYNNVKEMVQPHLDIDQQRLARCVDSFTRDILRGLESVHGDAWKRELVILSDHAAVNGVAGVKYIDRMNMSTSMGFPWNKTKRAFIRPSPTEEQPDAVTFDDEVWARIRAIEQCYSEGRRAYPVYSAHLKDEAVTESKIEAKKTRVFTGAPVDFSVVMRKHLLSFVRLLQQNKFVFEAGPGTVTQSIEWTHFHQYLTQFGTGRMVAGDYGKFDKRMVAPFILAAFRVIIDVHAAAGHTEEDLRIIECIAHDVAFPLVSIKGDIIEFFGTNPSGQPLTVIVNSLVNSLYMRYAYSGVRDDGREGCDDFKERVALLTYGDDNIMGVSASAPWFNHTAIQRELATIGVEYTMADKQAQSVPFIDIADCSFLKRTWRWEPELGAYAAPLEEESLLKSLTVWVPSRTIDKYAQMVAVMSAANSEYFFHGRTLFNERRSFFQRVLAEQPYSLYVEDSTLPDWDTLCQRFRQASQEFKDVPIPGVGLGRSVTLNS